METLTLSYNPHNTLAMSILQTMRAAKVFKIEENSLPYNADFVEKIRRSEQEKAQGKVTRIDLDNLWK